jgi:uncharacterized membrane protein YoaT (DUF817 family)
MVANNILPAISVFEKLDAYSPKGRRAKAVWEFVLFGIKQAWACLFGGILLFLIIATKYFWPEGAWLARYDFLFLAALAVQTLLILLKLETVDEAKVILLFHIAGTLMELFKTAHGSWSYPEPSLIRIAEVPLFSGFMYAAVGSYIARATRVFNLKYENYPSGWMVGSLAALIYINFFMHHYIVDIRGLIFILVGALFSKTWVYFTPSKQARRMPLLVGFCLIACFIWIAENIGTFTSIWLYPTQKETWHVVGLSKLGSWFLLMIISFALVTIIHPARRQN